MQQKCATPSIIDGKDARRSSKKSQLQQKFVTPSNFDGKDAFFVGQIVEDQRNPNSSKNMSLLLTLIAEIPLLWAKFSNIKGSYPTYTPCE